jgi:hypothetical protein
MLIVKKSSASVSAISMKCRTHSFPVTQPSLYCTAGSNSGELKRCERKYQNILSRQSLGVQQLRSSDRTAGT